MKEVTEPAFQYACDRCGEIFDIRNENGGCCLSCHQSLCEKCAGEWDYDNSCRKCHQQEAIKRIITCIKRIAEIIFKK